MGLGTLLIRADASPEIGTGHVMRCLALAQAWQDRGGQAVFATHNCVPAICQRLRAEKMDLRELPFGSGSRADASETAALIEELSPNWVVCDGFFFTCEYLSQMLGRGAEIALIDDHGTREHYDANIVINPNVFASPQMYSAKEGGAEFLLGLRFALIRREFRGIERRARRVGSKERLLVTMGGSDPDNVTLVILDAFGQVAAKNLEIMVVCGAANQHVAELEHAARRLGNQVRLLRNVQNMGEVLSSVDMAISAPGASAAEFAALGVPMLLVTMAENHARTAEEFASKGFAVSLGWWHQMAVSELASHIARFLKDSAGRLQRASLAAQHTDLLGAERVVDRMTAKRLGAIA